MDLKANLLTEYYFDNNILYTLSSKFYDSIDESLNHIYIPVIKDTKHI